MKILRVQFKNLNSLRGDEPHEVNFEKEPLRGATLFAITGPTGAGKSTLLDAITLALYGRAARYGNDPNPEDMMSRHCGECFASVDFEVITGRFRAEWHLWRARRRVNGEFQKPRRQIYDAESKPLTQNIREADKLIEEIIGLDYGRFLRSVMLAQGEFSRFLKAGANERAELLECLTGTEIYSELGTLAHEEASRRQTNLVLQEQALGAITIYTEEERRERAEAVVRQQAEANAAQNARDELHKRVERVRQLAAAVGEEAGLVRQQAELTARWDTAQPDLARLRTHRRTLPFAEALGRLDAANEQVHTQNDKLALTESEGARADLECRRTLAAAAKFARLLVETHRQRLGQYQQLAETHESRLKILADWLATNLHSGGALESALPGLIQSLNELVHRREELGLGHQRVIQLTEEHEAQAQAIQQAQRALGEIRARLAGCTTAKTLTEDAMQVLIKGGTIEQRRGEMDRLQDQLTTLRAITTKATQRLKLEERLAADRGLRSTEEIAFAAAVQTVTCLESQREIFAQQKLFQDDHLQKSKLWQSYEEQRAKLRSGDLCPLCGSQDHPWVHGSRPGISISQLEKALTETVARIKELDASLLGAHKAHTTAETRKTSLAEEIQKYESEIIAVKSEMTRLADGLSLAGDTLESLQAATTEAIDRLEGMGRELTQLQHATNELSKREVECLKVAYDVQTATTAEAAAVKRQEALQASAASGVEIFLRMEAELAVGVAALMDRLTMFGHTVPEAGREISLAQDIGVQQKSYREQEQAYSNAEKDLATTRRDVERCAQALAESSQRSEELCIAASSLVTLSEEDDKKLSANWSELEDANNAMQSRQASADLATAAAVRQKQDAAEARAKAQMLVDALEPRLVASNFSTLAELRDSRLDETVAAPLDALEKELERTGHELQGKLVTTRSQIESLRAGETAGEDVTALESRYATANLKYQELLTDIGQRRGELNRDEESRQQHVEGATALALAKERMTVWSRLQALIGSYDGAKFRRYAQGISLDLLVRRANRHLARLNDRYELRRRPGEELDLDIADHYQAGVTRPLASLSGGESFLSSLALALGLADLAGRNVRIESLFIDEGFGTLDADSLDLAINALDNLRRDRKTVGVISHVELLKERIPTQIVVEKGAGGVSRFTVRS